MLLETANLRLATQYRVATLTIDATDLSHQVWLDLEQAIGVVERHPGLDVLVLRATAYGLKDELTGPRAAIGQRVTNRLAALEPTTVAFLDGPWLGAPMELALACDYRVAVGGPKTRLGFPGLRAGVTPYCGGTARLPRVIGLRRALDLFLTGRRLSASQALAIGLVDRAFGPRLADVYLAAYVLELQSKYAKPRLWSHLDSLPGCRALVLHRARARVGREFSADQAAPRAIVQMVASGISDGLAGGFAAERQFREPAAQARGVRELKPVKSLACASGSHDAAFRHVAVIGGGTIGAAVAQWAALQGCSVAVHDRDPLAARHRLEAQFRDAVERRLISADAAQAKLDGIFCSDSWDGFTGAELVIEAVSEDRATKRHLLAEVQPRVSPAAVLATTTTAFTVRSLQGALYRPDRLVGLHFGCPAAALKCVEVSAGPATDPDAVARVRDWLAANGRVGVLVADRPGRALGRVMLAYLHEALVLIEKGVSAADLDTAMRRWGMAWGPCATLDVIGLDVALATFGELASTPGGQFDPPSVLTRLVLHGDYGRKTRRGLYRYGHGNPRPQLHDRTTAVGEAVIVKRLVSRLRREALSTVCEGVVGDTATLDALAIAAGWPPFRGGPLQRTAEVARPVRRPTPRKRRPQRVA
jgi:3-hydroxyacyl-CoA dehydrogenase/enoyl-CoA hydratase/3-hydroxybutyryl-CoA epimerase